MWSSNSLFLGEKLVFVSSLLIVICCAGVGLWRGCVSASPTCFNMGFFPFPRCVGVTQLVFGFFSEKIVPYAAVDLVCLWEEVASGYSYVAILD